MPYASHWPTMPSEPSARNRKPSEPSARNGKPCEASEPSARNGTPCEASEPSARNGTPCESKLGRSTEGLQRALDAGRLYLFLFVCVCVFFCSKASTPKPVEAQASEANAASLDAACADRIARAQGTRKPKKGTRPWARKQQTFTYDGDHPFHSNQHDDDRARYFGISNPNMMATTHFFKPLWKASVYCPPLKTNHALIDPHAALIALIDLR